MNLFHRLLLITATAANLAMPAQAEGVVNIYKPYRRGQRSSCHAEESALRNADPKRLMGARMYIVRVSQNEPMNSKPCPRCHLLIEKFMRKYGLKTAYYTNP